MHVRNIVDTEIDGMKLRHLQTLPEILYKGCVICFLNFNGDIEAIGSRIAFLNAEEFQNFKKLIGMIEFESEDGPDYKEQAKQALTDIRESAQKALDELESWDGISSFSTEIIRKRLIEVETMNAKTGGTFDNWE